VGNNLNISPLLTKLKLSASHRGRIAAGLFNVSTKTRAFVSNLQAQKHSAPLVALDFSEDSNYVQSASEDNELLYRESPIGCESSHLTLCSILGSAGTTNPSGTSGHRFWLAYLVIVTRPLQDCVFNHLSFLSTFCPPQRRKHTSQRFLML